MSTGNQQNNEIKSPEFIKAENELKSLITYFTFGLLFYGLYIIFLIWISITRTVNWLAYFSITYSLICGILLFLCRRDLLHRKKRALWFYLTGIGLSFIFTFIVKLATHAITANWLSSVIGLVVAGLITYLIYSFIKKGVLV